MLKTQQLEIIIFNNNHNTNLVYTQDLFIQGLFINTFVNLLR